MTPEELGIQAETLDLINTELAARLARQSDSSGRIDNKAVALAGYVVVAASFLATQHPQPVLAGLAYAAYAASGGFGAASYSVGSYRDVPDPRSLFNRYAARSRSQTLAALAAERVRAFEDNARKHERKARFWRTALAALAIGVTLMVAAIVVQH